MALVGALSRAVARMRAHGAVLIGEMRYEDTYRLAYIRGPEGITVALVDYLREQTVEVMSLNRVQFCGGRLETARLAISGKTDVEQVQSLERRHGSAA